MFIYVMEYSRGLPHSWVLRMWWLFAFMLASVRLQTVVVLIEHVPNCPILSFAYGYLSIHFLINPNFVFIVRVHQHDMRWDFILFFCTYACYTIVTVLGLWWNEVPVLELFQKLKEPSDNFKSTYSTFLPNYEERVIILHISTNIARSNSVLDIHSN